MLRGEQAQEVVDAAGAVQAHELQIVAGIRRGVIPCGDPPSRAHLLRRRENVQEQPRPVLYRRPPPGSVPAAVRDRSAALTDLIGDPRAAGRVLFRGRRRDPTVLPRGTGGLGDAPRGAAPSALQIPCSS